MTRKNSKMSLGVKIASILTCLALTAVGFASWLILKPAEEKTASGSFTVYSVEDNNIEITVSPAEANKIIFGHDGSTQSGAWLQYDEEVEEQVLKAAFDVTVKSVKGNGDAGLPLTKVLSSIDIKYDLDAYADKFTSAVNAGYLTDGVVTVDKGTYADDKILINTLDLSDDATEVTFKVTVTFGWGSAFNGQNPYTYFNSLDDSKSNVEKATTALTAIEAVKDTKYKLTIDTTNK